MKRDLVVIGHPLASSANEELHLLNYLMRNRQVIWINHSQESSNSGSQAKVAPQLSAELQLPLVNEFTPHTLLQSHKAWLQGLEQQLLKMQVQRLLQREKIQHPILWVNAVESGELAARLDGHKIIYFCNEEVPRWPTARRERWLQRQAALVAKADLILATDPAQITHFPAHKTCLLNTPLPLFNFTAARPKDLPRGRPIAGFYGTLDDRLDWALLAQAARSRPDWHWVLIGPNKSKQLTEVLRYKNIFWLGEKNYDELSSYLPHWQLLLLPYVTMTTKQPYHSLKLNEYLAHDKPVVMTTALPMEMGYRPLISQIHNATELAELLPVHYFISQEPDLSTSRPSYTWRSLLIEPAPPRPTINWEQQAAALAGLLDADGKL